LSPDEIIFWLYSIDFLHGFVLFLAGFSFPQIFSDVINIEGHRWHLEAIMICYDQLWGGRNGDENNAAKEHVRILIFRAILAK
jgi:hypothetical protein